MEHQRRSLTAPGAALVVALALVLAVLVGPGATAWGSDETPAPEPTASATPTATASTEPGPDVSPTPSATPEPTASPTPTATPSPRPVPKLVQRSVVVGTTVKGRTIRAYYRGWSHVKQTRSLLVLGQMHGDEKAGLRTADWVRRHVVPRKGSEIWVIPTMNPDGNARGTRTNARGVDLNRNWATSGWTSKGKGSRTWGGRRKASERETKAMAAFLAKHRPDYVASIHQPYGVIARNGKDVAWEKRLSAGLGLPRRTVGVGTPSKKTSPTLTAWYNRYHGKHGTAVTIEYRSKVSKAYAGKRAGRAITAAARVR